MNDEVGPVRVRFAPSPTGYLHIGGARSALFNYLFARHYDGQFLLRIEDTDRKRYKPDSLADILESLRWLGLEWDEGPDIDGPFGPYVQTERRELYHQYIQKLLDGGMAYYCFCTPQRLAEVRQMQRQRGLNPGYDRHCRNLDPVESAARVAAGESAVVRLKAPTSGVTRLHDLIRGVITWENAQQQDIVLLKSDGLPTYHFANVVDDHLMEISHVLRAEEWIPSAPIHVQLYQAFDWPLPAYAHLPVMLNPLGPDGKQLLPGKLSKRKQVVTAQDADDDDETPKVPDYTQVREFRDGGYLPEALFNFLALQGAGYSGSEEIFTREQLIELFTLDRVKPSPARLDYKKLDRFNGIYIRSLPVLELARRVQPFLFRAGLEVNPDVLLRVVPLIQVRLNDLDDAVELAGFFFEEEVPIDATRLVGKDLTRPAYIAALREAREVIATVSPFQHDALEAALRALAERLGIKAGTLFGMLREVLTGQQVAPPLFGTIEVLGRETALRRLEHAERILSVEE